MTVQGFERVLPGFAPQLPPIELEPGDRVRIANGRSFHGCEGVLVRCSHRCPRGEAQWYRILIDGDPDEVIVMNGYIELLSAVSPRPAAPPNNGVQPTAGAGAFAGRWQQLELFASTRCG
jgi:hypothetical protein